MFIDRWAAAGKVVERKMRIALDVAGGDNAPAIPVRGGVEALQHLDADFELLLVGDPPAIEAELQGENLPADRLHVVPATEVIGMNDPPVETVRRKPNSSIVSSVRLQESGEADAFISAGGRGTAADHVGAADSDARCGR